MTFVGDRKAQRPRREGAPRVSLDRAGANSLDGEYSQGRSLALRQVRQVRRVGERLGLCYSTGKDQELGQRGIVASTHAGWLLGGYRRGGAEAATPKGGGRSRRGGGE